MTPKNPQYPLLRRETITKLLPLIDSEKVSLVARGRVQGATPEGFLQAFYGDRLDTMATTQTTYRQRREGFINRHLRGRGRLWKANGHPTRRHLALVSWAYSPDPQGLKRYIDSQNLRNRNFSQFLGRG